MPHRFEINRGNREDVFFPPLVLTREDGLYIAGSLNFDPETLFKLEKASQSLEASGELRQLRSRDYPPRKNDWSPLQALGSEQGIPSSFYMFLDAAD